MVKARRNIWEFGNIWLIGCYVTWQTTVGLANMCLDYNYCTIGRYIDISTYIKYHHALAWCFVMWIPLLPTWGKRWNRPLMLNCIRKRWPLTLLLISTLLIGEQLKRHAPLIYEGFQWTVTSALWLCECCWSSIMYNNKTWNSKLTEWWFHRLIDEFNFWLTD